jgi:MFS family permease
MALATLAPPVSARGEWVRHWPVVLAAFLGSALNATPSYMSGVFMAPVIASTGWSRTFYFSGPSISGLLVAFLAPLVGRLIDRFGARALALPGIMLYTATIAAMALTNGSVWRWWLLWVGIGLFGTMVVTSLWTGAVQRCFDRSRGLAMSLALAGSGLSAAILPLGGDRLIAAFGWRAAFMAIGIGFLVLVLPAAFIALRGKAAGGTAANGPVVGAGVLEVLRSSLFVRLAITALITFASLTGVIFHFVPIARWAGMSSAAAAAAAGFVGVGSVTGKLIAGALLDKIRGSWVGLGAVAGLGVATGLLITGGHSFLTVAAAAWLVGTCLGAELSIFAYVSARYWGMRSYATLFGGLLSAIAGASAIGPLIAARIYDANHSYMPFFLWLVFPCLAIAAILFATLPAYPVIEREALA